MGEGPEGYRRRLIDARASDLLGQFGALLIEGPKWCGKTWTGMHHARDVVRLDDPRDGASLRQLAESDPGALLSLGESPLLIDEWQEVPRIWDAVRHAIDSGRQPGGFILTGSSTPRQEHPSHSGTGRFARIRMRTLSLQESGVSSGSASLGRLLEGDTVESGLKQLSIPEAIHIATTGGWPATAFGPGSAISAELPTQYLDFVLNSDLKSGSQPQVDNRLARALVASIARNSATEVSLNTLAADLGVDRRTVARYVNLLEDLFIVERVPAWKPNLRSRTRLRSTPKIMLTDPSLAISALRATEGALLRDLKTFGFIFESMCLRDLAVYCAAAGSQLHHYRDNSGLEVDAIVEGNDGQWGAIEIKLGANQVDSAAKNLLRLSEKMRQGDLPEPAFLMVLTANGATVKRSDGVTTASLATLGA